MPGLKFLPRNINNCCFCIPLHYACVVISLLCMMNGILLLIVRYYWACTFSYVMWRRGYEVVMWGAGAAQFIGGLLLFVAATLIKKPVLVYIFVIIHIVWFSIVALYLLLYFLGLAAAGSRSPLDQPECPRTKDNLVEVFCIAIQLISFGYFAIIGNSYISIITPESNVDEDD